MQDRDLILTRPPVVAVVAGVAVVKVSSVDHTQYPIYFA